MPVLFSKIQQVIIIYPYIFSRSFFSADFQNVTQHTPCNSLTHSRMTPKMFHNITSNLVGSGSFPNLHRNQKSTTMANKESFSDIHARYIFAQEQQDRYRRPFTNSGRIPTVNKHEHKLYLLWKSRAEAYRLALIDLENN